MGTPTREWTDWAFYDDGTESGSVIIGAKNTNPTLEVDTIYFFRAGAEETAGNRWNNAEINFEYNLNGGGWNPVTTASSVVRAVSSINVTDGDDTTQRMTAFTFITNNTAVDDSGTMNTVADPQNDGFEVLFVFQIQSGDVVDSDSIELRILHSAGSAFDVVNQTNPTVTVSEGGSSTVRTPHCLCKQSGIWNTCNNTATVYPPNRL